MAVKPKAKGLFDDFDSFMAEIDSAIKDISDLQGPAERPPIKLNKASTRATPVCIKDENPAIWRVEVIRKMQESAIDLKQITIEQFCDLLTKHAHHYLWQGYEPGETICGFSKNGYSFDPLTATCAAELNTHVSRCVSNLGGELLGLS